MKALERRLGLFSVITISISSMIGSGIFVLPGIGFQITGASLWLAFLLSAISILPAAISKAELATAMPSSGGTYIYIDRTFGPLAGTIVGLGLYLSILLKASFSLVGIGAYFSILSSFPLIPTMMSFLFFICILNILGVGKVSNFMTAILLLTIIGMAAISIFSIPVWDFSNMKPLLKDGYEGLASATALVFVSFAGVTKVAAIAEEVKEPEKNLPKGILLSLAIVTFLYCAASFILAGVFDTDTIAGDLRPIHTLAMTVGGKTTGIIMAVIAVLTMVNTSNAGVLAGSRFPFAMSRDKLLPSFIGKLHPKFLTPIVSILFSATIIAFILLYLDVTKIAKLASAFMIMIYMLENLAVIVLRELGSKWYRPSYKSPLYPTLQVLGIIASLGLLYSMGMLALTAIGVIAVPGILLYFLYSKRKVTRRGVIGLKTKRTEMIEESQNELRSLDHYKDAHVVVGLFGGERSPEMLSEMGAAIAQKEHLEVAKIIEIPEQTTRADIQESSFLRSTRRRVMAMAQEKEVQVTFDAIVSHDVPKTIYELSQRVHCEWLFIEWQKKIRGQVTFNKPIGWLKSHLHCNLATFKDSGVRYFRKIMVLTSEDKHDDLVIRTAEHLSNSFGAKLITYKLIHNKVSDKEHILNSIDEILHLSEEFDLIITGSVDHKFSHNFFATDDEKLMQHSLCSVLAVHKSSLLKQNHH